jgi:TetR/AcrR family transcriptional regulator, tetracycline repressor protein
MQLHRGDVLAGALALLETEGLDGLTTRKLASALDVQPGALYWHFKNKRALLDAMADKLLEGVGDPVPAGPWTGRLELLAGRYRAALLSHRDGARIVSGSFVPEANTVGTGAAFVAVLTDGGVPAQRAGWVWSTLKYYILGHCIEEQAQHALEQGDDWAEKVRAAEAAEQALDPTTAAALHAVVTSDPNEQFAYGLSLLVRGISQSLSG